MTLSFSTKWPERMGAKAGQPNYFIYYIWQGLPNFPYDHIKPMPDELRYLIKGMIYPIEYYFQRLYLDQFFQDWDDPSLDATWNEERTESSAWRTNPKVTTIREDKLDRWKPGMDIHFVINNRTKNRFQFAPVMKCVSVQKIEIEWTDSGTLLGREARVYIDTTKQIGKYLEKEKYHLDGIGRSLKALAINDGFDSVEDFFAYFNKDFKGKIIHWTDLKY